MRIRGACRHTKLGRDLREKLLAWANDVSETVASSLDVMPLLPVELRRQVVLGTQRHVIQVVPMFRVRQRMHSR